MHALTRKKASLREALNNPLRWGATFLAACARREGCPKRTGLAESQPPGPTLAAMRNLPSPHLRPGTNPLRGHLRAKPGRCGRDSTGEIRRACPVRLKGNE